MMSSREPQDDGRTAVLALVATAALLYGAVVLAAWWSL